MNSNWNSAVRELEAETRAKRLRIDWHTREALKLYFEHCSPLGVNAASLLAPYNYLNSVPIADFRWEQVGYDIPTTSEKVVVA